jgi:trk system potassium uptake protein TrkA
MKALIVGCGRVGAYVASELDGEHSVTVIDWSPSAFDRLASDFNGETIVGNGIDVEVLKLGQANQSDVFMALTDSDNTNLTAAQIAREMGAGRSIARVYDAERSAIYEELGLTPVSPTVYGAQRLFDLVVGAEEDV